MTICIAGICPIAKKIIAVCDTKLSFFSSDTGVSMSGDGMLVKARFLTADRRWGCLFSCTDLPRFESLYDRAVLLLSEFAEPVNSLAAEDSIARAYADELERIKAVDTGVELIVFGFGDDDAPHMFVVSSLGGIYPETAAGYAIIGAGWDIARNWLLRDESFLHGEDFLYSSDVSEAIYRLCEAKFISETVDGVGRETVVMALSPDGTSMELSGKMLDFARKEWRRRRTARPPKKVLESLRSGRAFSASGKLLTP